MDRSRGYDAIASEFSKVRGQNCEGIGASSVRHWAGTLKQGSSVLDLGCGTGIPISKVLIDAGMTVYGVDASAAMVKEFQQNFPKVSVACEAVEDSPFFDLQFDAIIAWGLMFLLPEDVQEKVILKAAGALHAGGKFLFTAPHQKTEWQDVMTKEISRSPGIARYKKLLAASGFSYTETFEDKSGNHYFNSTKA